MSAAFLSSSRPRGIWRRSYKPDAESCRRAIIDHWYDLIAREQRGDRFGAGVSKTLLHDFGVFYQRARKREAVPA